MLPGELVDYEQNNRQRVTEYVALTHERICNRRQQFCRIPVLLQGSTNLLQNEPGVNALRYPRDSLLGLSMLGTDIPSGYRSSDAAHSLRMEKAIGLQLGTEAVHGTPLVLEEYYAIIL